MAKIIFGAQAIIGAAALSTMGCTLITKLAIMNLGGLAWMNAKKVTMVNRKRLHLNLWKLLLRNLLSTTNFAMHSALRLAFPPKQLIKSGRMLREMSRSESRVEEYLDTSNILLPFITPDSNDLTPTHNTLFNYQDLHQDHGCHSLYSQICQERIAWQIDLLAFIPFSSRQSLRCYPSVK